MFSISSSKHLLSYLSTVARWHCTCAYATESAGETAKVVRFCSGQVVSGGASCQKAQAIVGALIGLFTPQDIC